MTLVIAITFCGSVFAQYESHWPGFNGNYFESQGGIVAAIMINGEVINVDAENWDALEVAAFVNDGTEVRATGMYLYDGYVQEYGDPFPILDGLAIYYTNPGDVVTFRMYDHMNEVLYETCEVTLLGEPFTVITGDDNFQGWDDPENPIFLNFIGETPAGETFTLDITGYGSEEGHWYLISSPIGETNPTNVENMLSNEYDLYAFDQTQPQEEWQNYENTNFLMEPGKGYLYANQEDVTLSFTGEPYDGDGVVTLVKEETQYLSGWNLVGNPFGETAYIDRDFYIMNEAGTEIVPAETEAIEPMQGIFVIAEENDESITFSTTMPAKSANLNLNISRNNNVVDRAIVNFDGKRSLPKFQLFENSTKIYIPMEGKDYAVVSAGEMGEMPVNFKAESNGSYTMNISTQEVSFTYLHLIDNMTGADVNLLETPYYTFNAQTNNYASRFRLVFATGSSVDGDSFSFINGAGNLCIFGIEGEATVQVVDVLGHVLSSETFSGSYEKKFDVAPSVYMIRLIQGNDVKTQKMVIK